VRIAYVITRSDAVGGASIHVRDLAASLQQRGHQTLVLLGGAGPVTEQLAAAGVEFRHLRHLRRSLHPVADWLSIKEVEAALRQFRPDLISLHTAKAGWVGRLAAARLGVPAFYTPHGWPFGGRFGRPASRLYLGLERAVAAKAAAIICVCRYERELALLHRVGRPEQLHVIYNGVRDVESGLRAAPGSGPVLIVSVARFEPPKDHCTLIEALARLATKSWRLSLVGDGPKEPAIRALASKLGLAERIQFLGYLAYPAPVLAQAHIFALASRAEGFPRSLLEAMRAGLPIVASRVGGVAEAVEDGVEGFLVTPEDTDELAGRLAELIRDGALRSRMGACARRKFDERFRLERMVEETLALYRQFA